MKLLLLMGYFLFVALACASQESSAQKTFVVPGTLALDSSAVVQREELISFARAYLGRPYRYAGSDPKKGFDCSGFVHFVFNHFNIDSPRDSRSFDRLAAGKKPEDFKVG
ncbi:MAG: NlpC/P60 family protein, partial [Marinilabiliales bacterium]|nr:NlpC/P60 family protein [Marinilabiliales bacterium]